MYIVVYENDKNSGLLYGTRYIIEHKNKNSVQEHPQENTVIIAEEISLDEANRLVDLTPEICLFVSSLSELESISIDQIPLIEEVVRHDLIEIRNTINTHQIERIDARKYIAHFRELAKLDNRQSPCISGYLARLSDQYTGQILTL